MTGDEARAQGGLDSRFRPCDWIAMSHCASPSRRTLLNIDAFFVSAFVGADQVGNRISFINGSGTFVGVRSLVRVRAAT